jgi:AcrR family transcriptional regulator
MAQDKRAALLEAAEAVFVERGITRATIDEITARAGVAKGTFYLYFSSKAEVVQALNDRLWQGHVALASAAAEALAEGDWWAEVDGFVERVLDYDLEHREWHRLVAQSGNPDLDHAPETEQQMIDLVAAAIQIGVDRGACQASDPLMTATLLYRAVQGTSHQYCQADAEPDRERLLAAFRELARKVLAVPGLS